jgi:anhydro-N-acetylmuramic acid kinase
MSRDLKSPDLLQVLQNAREGRNLVVLGMMSGTSVDGIDGALCRVGPRVDMPDRLRVTVLGLTSGDFDEDVRQRIFEAFRNGPGSLELATGLALSIGREYSRVASMCLKNAREVPDQADLILDAIAVHGQTIWHSPPPHKHPGTFQCVDPSVIAQELGVTVVSDFRRADMALGGQGAPLVPFFDWNQYSSPDESRIILNIGGIANVTVLPAAGDLSTVTGFDTGPGNVLMDLLATEFLDKSYDNNGEAAARGKVIHALVEKWMGSDYFSRVPPKSTGRELFGRPELADCLALREQYSGEDFLATAAEWTAVSIADAIKRHVAGADAYRTLLVAGGGALNPHLIERLNRACNRAGLDLKVHPIPGGYLSIMSREAAAFAMMGYATLAGKPSNVPSVTGASRPAILGMITPPGISA